MAAAAARICVTMCCVGLEGDVLKDQGPYLRVNDASDGPRGPLPRPCPAPARACRRGHTCPAQSLPLSRTGMGCFFFLKKVLPADQWNEKNGIRKNKSRLAWRACRALLNRYPLPAARHPCQQPCAAAALRRRIPEPAPAYELGQAGEDTVISHKEVVGVAELALGLVAFVLGPTGWAGVGRQCRRQRKPEPSQPEPSKPEPSQPEAKPAVPAVP